MKLRRFLTFLLLVVVFFEVLLPFFTAKTGILLPMIANNCGPAYGTILDLFSMPGNVEGDMDQIVDCGWGIMALLVVPGILSFLHFAYKTVRGRTE